MAEKCAEKTSLFPLVYAHFTQNTDFIRLNRHVA